MNKKDLGAFYTPEHTIKYMIDQLNDFDKKSTLLEPCGGDGAFVSYILKNSILNNDQITVWDLNPKVKSHFTKMKVKFQLKDTLLDTSFEDNKTPKEIQKFTHIIGNPPYLNKQSSYIKTNKKRLRKIYKEIGVNDTYALFTYLCSKLLEAKGQLCFITSDTFLTLGIHKKFREYLLKNFTINSVTLCPKYLFKHTGANVNTSIIYLTNSKPENNIITFNDCRNLDPGDYKGKKHFVKQTKLMTFPDYIFDFEQDSLLLKKIQSGSKLIDYVEGGLGMHTTDNRRFLGIVDYDGVRYAKNKSLRTVRIDEVTKGNWKFYHKKGGDIKYYQPAEFCVKWDRESIKHYKMPKNYNLNDKRQGFIISGVCSSLSSRLATVGALWESNKAMCFFPNEPDKFPPEFFVGLLNSDIYNKILKKLNHANSIQIRDIKKLPFFDFSTQDVKIITDKVKQIVKQKERNLDYNYFKEQKVINNTVKKYFL